MKYQDNITLKHLVFAYETFDKDYMNFNYFLSILSLITIYKTYYVSEQNNKMIWYYTL